MEPGAILRVIMIATGVLLFGITLSSLAKRMLTEPFCMTWGLVSVIIILAGILLRPDEWIRYISFKGMMMVVMLGFCVIYGMLFMSAKVSGLMRKNQELAMQVSLLKHENDNMQEKLEKLWELHGEQEMEPGGQGKRSRTAEGQIIEDQTAGGQMASKQAVSGQTTGEQAIRGQTIGGQAGGSETGVDKT